MTAYVALLRAVNVGCTGTLPMRDLVSMCEAIGFASVRTYVASGNVVFLSDASEPSVKSQLEEALSAYGGKPVDVLVRTAREIADVLANNPFPNTSPNKTAAIFLGSPPAPGLVDTLCGRKNEELGLGPREIYVHYPDGMGRSKLKIPAAEAGTARNMNTVAKLARMAAEL